MLTYGAGATLPPAYADVCWRMLTYADVWCRCDSATDEAIRAGISAGARVIIVGQRPRPPPYADVCCCVQTYADLCSRMLTYADVCGRMVQRRAATKSCAGSWMRQADRKTAVYSRYSLCLLY